GALLNGERALWIYFILEPIHQRPTSGSCTGRTVFGLGPRHVRTQTAPLAPKVMTIN
ncbi:MAG: hypothetical protein QOD93_4035, partial [Acetobacteraceae bacterium]|nr:hypothetical protein [Acetobacteraceae bacterium]